MNEDALSLIERTVASFREGVRIAELEQLLRASGWQFSRRSLLRYLKELIATDRVCATGLRRPTYYPPDNDDLPEVSAEELSLRQLQAGPVAFHRDFLLVNPKGDSCLDEETKKRLHQISAFNQPAGSGPLPSRASETFVIDLSWASSHLEGNRYSHLQAEKLLTFGEAGEGMELLDTQMILNHREAIELLTQGAEEITFNSLSIRNLHAILSDNLLSDPEAYGRLRQVSVRDGDFSYFTLSTPKLLEEYFERALEAVAATADPIEQSFLILVYFTYLQPFDHLNGSVARLAVRWPGLSRQPEG